MKKIIKKKWVAALRSGEYKKAKGTLKKGNGFCCLGVLTDMYCKAKKIENPWQKNNTKSKSYSVKLTPKGDYEYHSVTPEKVMKWSGLARANPIADGKELAVYNDRGDKNDKQMSFKKIAKLIEDQL